MNRPKPLPEQLLDDGDDAFPALAVRAGRDAYQRALQAGQTVLIAEGSVLYEVLPTGERRVIKQLQPLIPVQAGRVLKLW